ncbi:MAG: tRNA preQ1(34) S-adenosylmethionine ribosyltransferase-isomerase QueA [Oscillospiraceae bacterium]|nr:tRNA preQ1(34) S-adenosylmethionine ribosyltransferase-isomerase QueA [Oscillospiraceae bacterium]
MKTSDYDYDLPEGLIAQTPSEVRDASRLLALGRAGGRTSHRRFADVKGYLRRGDCLVINDTKVIPARLYGVREATGGRVELMLIEGMGDGVWAAMAKPGRSAKPGARYLFGDGGGDGGYPLKAEVLGDAPNGGKAVRLTHARPLSEALDEVGRMPLPPYIKDRRTHERGDRYQTVYAANPGSIAAPTAGLHFTEDLLGEIAGLGVRIARVTLSVGLGTFRPVRSEEVEDHAMHAESFRVGAEACDAVNACREGGGRVVAVGTTSLRTLEGAWAMLHGGRLGMGPHGRAPGSGAAPSPLGPGADGRRGAHPAAKAHATEGKWLLEHPLSPVSGRTDIFIYPPYEFKVADGLITNFHIPRSTLLMLVCAFAGREGTMRAYGEAIARGYRFYSFGDAMLII